MEGRNNVERVVNVSAGREEGQGALISLHCANSVKETLSCYFITAPPLLSVPLYLHHHLLS